MSKSSKQISSPKINSTAVKFHAAPVSSFSAKNLEFNGTLISGAQEVLATAGQKSSVLLPVLQNTVAADVSAANLNAPIHIKQLEQPDPNVSLEQIDQEVVTSTTQKLFSLYTGLFETEPSLVLSSEFLPLYNQGSKSSQGEAIVIKETAKIITSKTAINILSQSSGARRLLRDNVSDIQSYVESEQDFVVKLLKLTNDTLGILDVGSYALPVNNQQDSIGSTYEILKKSGYNTSNIVGYSETKMWQQSLLEVKRAITAHSPNLTDQNFSRKNVNNDSDPYVLSDIESPPDNLKKIWMNPYHPTLPTLNDLTNISKINESMTAFFDFEKKQYVNLVFANAALPTENTSLSGDFSNKAKVAYNKSLFSNKVLETYSPSGKDISIIANCITKETAYSTFLTKQENISYLQSNFGYSVSNSGDNFQVWDHIIGRFPKKVSDIVLTPAGEGRSLVSYSQRAVKSGNDYYNVLTFENNTFESVAITPGSTYYVDSTLSTTDGKTFDISRLNQLIDHTSTARKTTETIFGMLGYDISNIVFPSQGIYEDYAKKQYVSDVSLESMVDRLSIVANTYRSCIDVSAGQIVKLDTRALGSIGYKLMSGDVIGVRLASLICKLAVYPSGLYTKVSSRLKTLLFLWLVNVALQQNDPRIKNASTILDLKKRIASYIGSVPVKITTADLERAMWQYRNVPVTSTTASDISAEQINMNSVVREKKAAASSYVQAVYNKIFSVDADKGIWKIIVDMLKSTMLNSQIYVNDFTAYSGMSKVAYLYNNFDLMLRIIAAQAPENIVGMYTKTRSQNNTKFSSDIVDTGILIDDVTKSQLDEYYNVELMLANNYSAKYFVNKLKDAIDCLNVELNTSVRHVAFYRKYLLDIGRQLNVFKDYLVNNFESHLTRVNNLYQADASLTTNQRNALLSLSFSEEQLRLSRYIMSEYSDRINNSSQSETNLKTLPAYSDMPARFIDYMPINEMEAISYWMLSPYFKTEQFLSSKGNNKKIISIGIPPRLIRSIHTSQKLSNDSSKFIKQNLIRVKLYKLDRLHPDVVYLPKTYVFEMTRYPTRVAANWNFNAFSNNEFSLLNIPSKFMNSSGEVVLHKNFDEAFPKQAYGAILKEEEKYQIYANHSISFLCEEYLRWFTECKFDETRYSNFSQLSPELLLLENQYSNFVNQTISSGAATLGSQAQQSTNQVNAIFVDPLSKQTYSMPLNIPKNNVKIGTENIADKIYTIPIDKTIRSYFMNETFMLSTDISKRRMSYLKKFDRVFSVLFDPDDFYVDESLTNEATLRSMKNLGIITGGETVTTGVKSPYKHRDTMPNDTSFEEYFVTVEPYDYIQEYR